MSTDTVNLVLGIAGLALGFLAAYGQLKAIASRLFHVSGSSASKLLARREATARFYIANPSALIAHVARCFIWFIALMFVLSFLRAPNLMLVFGLPQWLAGAVSFVAPIVPGAILGSLVSMCALILDLSRRDAKET